MTDRQLTEFQVFAKDAILFLLEKNHLTADIVEGGQNETFLYLETEPKKLCIWLYEDEAELRTSAYQRLYERESFHNNEELLEEFLKEVATALGHHP